MNLIQLLSMILLTIAALILMRPFLAFRREEVLNAKDAPADKPDAPATIEDVAKAEVEAMTPQAAPKGITEEEISAKVAVGLTRDQAIEVLKRQADEDAAVAKGKKKA
jgi:hypothetical protein